MSDFRQLETRNPILSSGGLLTQTIRDWFRDLVDILNGLISRDGAISSFARTLLDDADAATARTTLGLASGTYTPTLTNVANLDSTSALSCQYLRVGDVVTVSGALNANPTAAASTRIGISLPIASNLANVEDCSGTGVADGGTAGQCVAIKGDGTNNRAEMIWVAGDVTAQNIYFTFAYRVI